MGTAATAQRDDRSRAGVKDAVDDAAQHRATQLLARSGLAARGVVYVVVAFIAAQIALSSAGDANSGSGHPASGPGAVHTLAGGLGGRVALIVLAVGLAGYTVFSVLDAVLHHDDPDKSKARRWGDRLLSLWGAALYAVFSVWTFQVALSSNPDKANSSQSRQEKAGITGRALSWPAGQFIVGLVGAIIAIAGAALFRRAFKRTFLERLDRDRMSDRSWRMAQVLGVCGIVARGLAYWVIAGMIMTAAIENDPGAGQGLDGSLRTVAGRPWGPYLLFPIALGLFSFGLYLFFETRYRRVSKRDSSTSEGDDRADAQHHATSSEGLEPQAAD